MAILHQIDFKTNLIKLILFQFKQKPGTERIFIHTYFTYANNTLAGIAQSV